MNTLINAAIEEDKELLDWLLAYVEIEDAKKAARAAMKKAANAPRPFISFPELAFPSDWCPPPIENRLSYVTPGAADDEVFTSMNLCDCVFGVVSVDGATIKLRSSLRSRYMIGVDRRVVHNKFCPDCGEVIAAAAG